jgi:hypothetical protein
VSLPPGTAKHLGNRLAIVWVRIRKPRSKCVSTKSGIIALEFSGPLNYSGAPIMIGRCDGCKLNRDNMARCNQPVGIVRVLSAAALQCLQFALHGSSCGQS